MRHPSNNDIYKSIRKIFSLSNDETVEILRLGGVSVSKTQVNGWGRGIASLKCADSGSLFPEQREHRFKIMKNSEFWAFWDGLHRYISTNLETPKQ